MSDNTGRLIPPSEAYEESAGGFRIPEVTLGSFFVSCGLGFYPLLAQLATQSHGRWGAILVSIQYVSISVSFMFLTVTFYAKYRAEILTMPQVELNRPGMDLILTVTGLLAFAFSMAAPWLFPILLGNNLLLIALRQNKEYNALASLFYEVLCKRSVNGDAYDKVRNALKRRFRVLWKQSRNGNKYDAFRSELKRYLRNDAFSELSGGDRRDFGSGSFQLRCLRLV